MSEEKEREHHRYGFSSWPALSICGGWESDGAKSEAAKRGTELHKQYADALNKGDPENAADAGAAWAARLTLEVFKPEESAILLVEKKLDIRGDVPMSGVYGYCDAMIVQGDRMIVFDYKSGRSGMDYMPQLAGYAMAAATMSKTEIKSFDLYVLFGGDFVKEERLGLTWDQLVDVASTVEANLTGSLTPKACDWCKYCRRRSSCSAANAVVNKAYEGAMASMSAPVALAFCEQVEKLIDAEKEKRRAEIEAAGGAMEDMGIRYEIKEKKGRSTGVDVASLYMSAPVSIASADMMGACTITKKNFTALVLKNAKEQDKSVKKVEVEKLYDSRCTFGEPTKTLVRTK